MLQSTVIQLYEHLSKINLFINMSSKVLQPSCCVLTIKIKKFKSCFEMFKMSCVIVRAPCSYQARIVFLKFSWCRFE